MVASSSDRLANVANQLAHLLCMICSTHWYDILTYKLKHLFSHTHFSSDSRAIISQAYLCISLTHLHCTFTNSHENLHTHLHFTSAHVNCTCTLTLCTFTTHHLVQLSSVYSTHCKLSYTLAFHIRNLNLSTHIILCNCRSTCHLYLAYTTYWHALSHNWHTCFSPLTHIFMT